MENTQERTGLDRGLGHQVDPPPKDYGARVAEGFETYLAAEDDEKPPTFMFTVDRDEDMEPIRQPASRVRGIVSARLRCSGGRWEQIYKSRVKGS